MAKWLERYAQFGGGIGLICPVRGWGCMGTAYCQFSLILFRLQRLPAWLGQIN